MAERNVIQNEVRNLNKAIKNDADRGFYWYHIAEVGVELGATQIADKDKAMKDEVVKHLNDVKANLANNVSEFIAKLDEAIAKMS